MPVEGELGILAMVGDEATKAPAQDDWDGPPGAGGGAGMLGTLDNDEERADKVVEGGTKASTSSEMAAKRD